MSSPMPTSSALYDSPEGRDLVKKILFENASKSIVPHDYQLEGICKVLDGTSLIATMATGAGKTGFYSFLMIVLKELAKSKELQRGARKIPSNPCMLLISPTKALQEDMRTNMARFGIDALVINGDACKEAAKVGRDLWTEAAEKPDIIIISPEELQSKKFSHLLNKAVFSLRTVAYGVDELHLLYWWGHSFRELFKEVGHVRRRFPLIDGNPIPLIGTTATLRVGKVQDNIFKMLGLGAGNYELIRQSNMRHDIQLIFRELKSGLGGTAFPELDWILREGRKTVIFCKTIALGFRVACYLWRRALAMRLARIDKRIRLYNSLNWPSYNTSTLAFLNNNEDSTITIATDVLSVGWDCPSMQDAVILGEPDDVDEFVQKIGRVGRNRQLVTDPRAFLYYSSTALKTARSILEIGEPEAPATNSATGTESTPRMDISMARLLLAACKPNELDLLYENPQVDLACSCPKCTSFPPSQRPATCNCSGCNPGLAASELPNTPIGQAAIPKKPRAKPGQGMPARFREIATAEFIQLRQRIFRDADAKSTGFLPPVTYLADKTVKALVDQLYSLTDINEVSTALSEITHLDSHHQDILDISSNLRTKFSNLREEEKKRKKEAKHQEAQEESESENENEEEIDDGNLAVIQSSTDEDDNEVTLISNSITWRINAR